MLKEHVADEGEEEKQGYRDPPSSENSEWHEEDRDEEQPQYKPADGKVLDKVDADNEGRVQNDSDFRGQVNSFSKACDS